MTQRAEEQAITHREAKTIIVIRLELTLLIPSEQDNHRTRVVITIVWTSFTFARAKIKSRALYS